MYHQPLVWWLNFDGSPHALEDCTSYAMLLCVIVISSIISQVDRKASIGLLFSAVCHYVCGFGGAAFWCCAERLVDQPLCGFLIFISFWPCSSDGRRGSGS